MVLFYFPEKVVDSFLMDSRGFAARNITVSVIKKQQEAERTNGAIHGFRGLDISTGNKGEGLLFCALFYYNGL